MGHTIKRDDGRLAGGHGEGLKIAALVLTHENCHVRIPTNGSYWNFNFSGQSKAYFSCRLTTVQGRPMGGPKGRLPLEAFHAWMADTVDLHAATGRVRTPFGDLLLEPVYRGRLYLKGIRVPEPSLDGKAVKFGYNLFHGRVGRDRQRLLDPDQVTKDLHRIWSHAIVIAQSDALP
ncbi:uncharacterized protein KD926_002724 [Aspergillus affinis]|uniref:uncharacterized protein n=1 Tax=Aspergillus affinis TaxID=1070780 RepID=UPI0022FE67B9|nr:uncharacterized protein KD926_002724 [Aspergillus affinis]KAI9043834.1 hypothetical protein KD926_002724 [Aspergillus affinis]